MSKVRVKLVRSIIGRSQKQKDTVKALGLKKLGSEVEKNTTPVVLGMIKKVEHLVTVEEL